MIHDYLLTNNKELINYLQLNNIYCREPTANEGMDFWFRFYLIDDNLKEVLNNWKFKERSE